MSKDLRSYLDELLEKRPKDVVVVDKEVDPKYEASGIVEKFERENKFPLVFFKNIKGSKIPLVINLGATYERLALSLGSPSVPQMVKDLAHREHHPLPVKEISVKDAPCKEVILKGNDADLDLSRANARDLRKISPGVYPELAEGVEMTRRSFASWFETIQLPP